MRFVILLCFVALSWAQAPKCGVPAIKPDTSTNIIGGKDAVPYSWPWQVSIYRKRNATYFSHTCGATVISKQWIMSAAHCFAGEEINENYLLKLGVYNQEKDNEQGEQILKIVEIHVHPSYNQFQKGNDMSLLKLEKPLEFSDHISPVCLPELNEDQPAADTNVFLTGWGKIRAGPREDTTIPIATNLKQVAMPLLSQQRCGQVAGTLRPQLLLCMGDGKSEKSACFGDSGGPTVIQDPKTSAWKQIGIASFVTDSRCAGYSVYSRVSSNMDFVKKYVTDLP
jgi:secreted trypsin-like serine protease